MGAILANVLKIPNVLFFQNSVQICFLVLDFNMIFNMDFNMIFNVDANAMVILVLIWSLMWGFNRIFIWFWFLDDFKCRDLSDYGHECRYFYDYECGFDMTTHVALVGFQFWLQCDSRCNTLGPKVPIGECFENSECPVLPEFREDMILNMDFNMTTNMFFNVIFNVDFNATFY